MRPDPDAPARMVVVRAGYFNGTYARPGDVIDVPGPLVDTLELGGFAAVPEPPPPSRRKGKDLS
jgi:hypothetical protein